MGYIKNYASLVTSKERKIVLDLVECAIDSIRPQNVIGKNVSLSDGLLKIRSEKVNLGDFEQVFLLGFGKGAAENCAIIELILGNRLTEGYVIDVSEQKFSKIEFTLGTHPLPSQENLDFTNKIVNRLSRLSEKDLVITVTCGGGSVMLEKPYKLSLEQIVQVNKALLKTGADIDEVNTIRKHLSQVKGGGLAKIVYPATVFNLIFSDVAGNDLSVIASGPTVKDKTTEQDALNVLLKYGLIEKLNLSRSDFVESPKEDKYFEKVHNILLVSNRTALEAMKQKAQEFGFKSMVYSDQFRDEAREAGKKLIDQTHVGTILLVGGETHVNVVGKGEGGRNQELVLGALPFVGDNVVIASFDSDGWDNSQVAGAIGDIETKNKAQAAGLDPQEFLVENNSLAFFEAVGDAILTGRLPSNVSDLAIVLKK